MSDGEALPALTSRVVFVRDRAVLVDAHVAEAFGVETREVNQAVARNPEKFAQAHAFRLTKEEAEFLRSQGVIPKPGRGGSRVEPAVFTQKGVARLATVLTTPRALEATDLIIDVFTEVYCQLAQGQTSVALSRPARLLPPPEEAGRLARLRGRMVEALEGLLDTVVDVRRRTTVREELGDAGAGLLDHLRERLAAPGVENARVEADTALILEKARDLRERRHADLELSGLEAERRALENLDTKITLVERLIASAERLEPNALVRLYADFQPTGRPAGPNRDAAASDDDEEITP